MIFNDVEIRNEITKLRNEVEKLKEGSLLVEVSKDKTIKLIQCKGGCNAAVVMEDYEVYTSRLSMKMQNPHAYYLYKGYCANCAPHQAKLDEAIKIARSNPNCVIEKCGESKKVK